MTRNRKLLLNQRHQSEATLLRNVTDYLAYYTHIKTIRISDRYNKGYSDLFICADGRFVASELKADKGVASPHQKLFIKDISRAGAVGGICWSIQEVLDLINKAMYCSCDKEYPAVFCPHCGRRHPGAPL